MALIRRAFARVLAIGRNMARIFVFAFDLGEASQLRRIRCLKALGHDVRVAGFRRMNQTAQTQAEPGFVDLGKAENNRLGRRAIGLIAALARFFPHRALLRDCDVVIARNFDLLVLAWIARALSGARRAKLVYECLDIHGVFTREDTVGRLMRRAEGHMLRRTDLLIVSSPGFTDNYFRRVHNYDGPVGLIENKMWFDGPPAPRPAQARAIAPARPLTLGWVGSIRCAPSLRILTEAARIMGDGLAIRIHGNVHRHAVPGFDQAVAELPGMTYAGEYTYPHDLAAIYGACDLVWSQDLWQRGANSDWLLPNRIYEASWFGCPSIAVADTETGRRVRSSRLGFVIDRPDSGALVQCLRDLPRERIRDVSQSLLDRDEREFRLLPEDVGAAMRDVMPAPEAQAMSRSAGNFTPS